MNQPATLPAGLLNFPCRYRPNGSGGVGIGEKQTSLMLNQFPASLLLVRPELTVVPQ
ncbi:MAG: hypothetical protein AABY75_05630 [Bacteroidota bacterium]